jgi:hypothetical protein
LAASQVFWCGRPLHFHSPSVQAGPPPPGHAAGLLAASQLRARLAGFGRAIAMPKGNAMIEASSTA